MKAAFWSVPRSRSVACWILRHRWPLWGLLALLCAASAASLPYLRLAFGFKGVMREGHPARVRLEAYEREFRLGETLVVHLASASRFTGRQLAGMRDLSGQIERLDGVNRVFSATDILEPAAGRDHQTLVPILSPPVLADEARTLEVLCAPPFSDRWIGYLYDRGHTIHTMVVRPTADQDDPWLTVGLLGKIEARLDRFGGTGAGKGLTKHESGLFYLNGEMLRSTFRDQGWLTFFGLAVLTSCFWALFGSLTLAAAVMGVLGLSILLGFGVMVLLGVPMNGLSGNLPILTLVNGLEDVVHLLVFFFATRRRAAPSRAAATAIQECLVPNFLTSLTTFGALIVTGATDMVLLQSFGYAICIGVIVEYFVAIVYLPLILMWFPWRPERCLYYRLDAALSGRWLEPWTRAIRSRLHLSLWVLFCLGLIVYSLGQHINSNWYRYFVDRHPVTGTLRFLDRHRFPINTMDCTIPVGMTLDELVKHPEVERDLRAMAARIEKVPGVLRVDTWADVKEFIDSRVRRLTFDPSLPERWVRARKEAVYRQYLELGAFDEYYSAGSRKLRLVVATTLEDANGLLALSRRVEAAARAVRTEDLNASALVVSGSTAYWGAIMEYVSRTFFVNVLYTILFIYVVFLFTTRSFAIATCAMVPNVLPIFVMFSAARFAGYDLYEGFCVIDSLAIGNSVNDTIHYIFHVNQNIKRGLPLDRALSQAFKEVGCAMVISSLLVAVGFSACLAAEGIPVIQSGAYMGLACVVAVLMDVLMHPALLARLSRWPGERGGPK
ncbi:MAG: MMPL family transporter [Candidatus Riflebacteria bacterium]|nr:MMPL family transporter [Candidatus Riflebacteria bacterium]